MNKKGIVLFLEIWRNNLFARKMQKGLEHRVKEGMKSNKQIVKSHIFFLGQELSKNHQKLKHRMLSHILLMTFID